MGEREIGPKSLIEWVNRCQKLGRYSVVCSGIDEFIGFESLSVRCDEFRCDRFPSDNGMPYFPFYRLRESMDYSGGKNKNERERGWP